MTLQLSQEIQHKLQALGVIALYLYGSRAQGYAGPLSDYDFAVLMDRMGNKRGGKIYDQVYDLLSPLCPRTLENDVIDIVFLNTIPLELRMHVIRYGQVLYDCQPNERLRFEERTTLEYCDFRPLLDVFDRTLLASL